MRHEYDIIWEVPNYTSNLIHQSSYKITLERPEGNAML